MRRNWAVQEFVETFQNARHSVLDLAKKEAARLKEGDRATQEPLPKKRKVDRIDVDKEEKEVTLVQASPQRARTRSQRTRNDMPPSEPAPEEAAEVIEDSQDDGEEEYIPG